MPISARPRARLPVLCVALALFSACSFDSVLGQLRLCFSGVRLNPDVSSVAGIGSSGWGRLACARRACRLTRLAMVLDRSKGTSLVLNSPKGARLVLIGTAHISAKDAALVKKVIASESPDSVVLELDPARLPRLNLTLSDLGDKVVVPRQPVPAEADSFAPWDPRGWAASLAAPLIRKVVTSMYDSMSARGMRPGGEFEAGILEGRRVGARLVLGDLESVSVLESFLLRTASTNPFDMLSRYQRVMWEEVGESMATEEITPEFVEKMKTNFVLNSRLFDRLRDEVPEFYETLIQSRDKFLASAISEEEERGSASIVGVVGLGHLKGIEEALQWSREAEVLPPK